MKRLLMVAVIMSTSLSAFAVHADSRVTSEVNKDESVYQQSLPPKASTGPEKVMEMQMDPSSLQGGTPPPDARNADDYADGLKLGLKPGMDMADNELYGQILLDKFEFFTGEGSNGIRFDGQAWVGGDHNQLWFKADGGKSDGEKAATRTELLWNRTFAPYWSSQIGVRHDLGDGPDRNWLAFGVVGLAPYWFDVEATAYVGENGRTALRGEVTYDWLLTQRLILQPNVEINLYGKDDHGRSIGAGVSELEAGLRLRYEIKREFAPYIGINWKRKFGQSADFARDEGRNVDEAQLLLGVRVWY